MLCYTDSLLFYLDNTDLKEIHWTFKAFFISKIYSLSTKSHTFKKEHFFDSSNENLTATLFLTSYYWELNGEWNHKTKNQQMKLLKAQSYKIIAEQDEKEFVNHKKIAPK